MADCARRTFLSPIVLSTAFLIASAPAGATGAIEGYATAADVPQGGTLELHVSTEALTYDVLIEDALDPTAIFVEHQGLPGSVHPIPDSAFAWGCDWPVSLEVPVAPTWPSGVYYARLIARDVQGQPLAVADTSFVPFVVTEDVPGSTSSILFQLSNATYNAYNNWGGKSLYPQNSTNNRRSYFVSFARPYSQERGKGEFPWWERPLAAWFRAEGIPVEYCTNVALHRDPNLTAPYRLFLSVGHDEYYSKEMYDQLEGFRNSGGNLAFFGANCIFWQVRLQGDTVVCYKEADLDPYFAAGYFDRVTVNWRQSPVNRPEGRLIGVQFDSWCWRPCGAPLMLIEPNHWMTRELGLLVWQTFGTNLVGYEWDRRFTNAEPPGIELPFLSYVYNHSGDSRYQQTSYYEHPATNPLSRVFAAGTIQWSWGVRPDSAGADPSITAITRRVVRCLDQPPTLAADREVIFTADLRHVNLSPFDTVFVRGQPAPLLPDGRNYPLRDDGVPPDVTAGDRIFTRAVLFPAGTWDIVRYQYWTIGQCGYGTRSAWIEDPELGAGPSVTLRDRPDYCPVTTAVDDGDPSPPLADGIEVRVQRSAGRIEIGIAAADPPPGTAGIPQLRVALYDVTGRLVRVLADQPFREMRADLVWAGEDERGHTQPAGIYLLDVRVGDRGRSAKIFW